MAQPNQLQLEGHTSPIPGIENSIPLEQSPQARITRLRDELQQGNPEAESVKDFSDVMYSFMADDVIETAAAQGKGGAVANLLRESIDDARIKEVELVSGRTSYMQQDGTMKLGLAVLVPKSNLLILETERFQFKQPGDERLLQAAHLVAHEQAHHIIHGAEQTLAKKASMEKGDVMKSYLLRHPIDGFTGNLATDRSIMHERFAEWGRISATRKTMALLGYEPHEINHYLSLVAHTPMMRNFHKKGHVQQDVLSRVTATAGPETLMPTDSLTKMRGDLGYAKPLTSEQSSDLLVDAANEGLIDKPDRYASRYFNELKSLHASQPDADAPAYIRMLQQVRQEDLHEQRETKTARVLGKLVSRLTRTSVAADFLNRTQRQALRDKFPVTEHRSFVPTQQTIAAHPEGPHHIRLEHASSKASDKIRL